MRRIGAVAIIYGAFGTLWILITDRLLLLFAHDPARITVFQTYKEPPGTSPTVFWLTHPDQKDAGKPASPALDSLTGLYNWDAFEKELRRLEEHGPDPGGEVVVCDIDGLSAINELGGTDCGNLAIKIVAEALKETLPSPGFLARIYSSGFAGIIPGPPGEEQDVLVKKLRKKIRDLEEEKGRSSRGAGPDLPFPISVSFGRASAQETAGNLLLAFRIAENRMRREKLLSSKSGRSAVVDALLQALSVRDFITAGHAERLEKMVVAMGKEAGLPAQRLADLRLFASLHDLGKLGVPDAILFKPGPLSPAERSEIENHCEYGYRIAITIPELIPIADLILKHHERWDGKGYPLGLKEEEIPLECRILSIADAFDAMTASRPYRAPVTKEDALAELERCAGSQFDPQLVRIFIKIVKNMAY